MRIRSLSLFNFRQFKGRHIIEFPVDWASDRNIILVGGLNGAGKTTLLEALRLAIFGKSNANLWQDSTYKRYIRDCMSRQAMGEDVNEFALAVELVTDETQPSSTMRIERHWRFYPDGEFKGETLHLAVDGKKELGLSPEELELLIQEYFPYGASQFVFFDGEKIQELAKDEGLGDSILESLQDVLGLGPYRHLEADLWVYENAILRSHADSEEFRKAQQDLDRNRAQLAEVRSKRQKLQEELNRVQQQLAGIQAERKRLGNQTLRDRWERDETLNQLRTRREELKHQLTNLVSHDLPLAILQPLLLRLKERLEREIQIEQRMLVRSLLEQKKAELFAELTTIGSIPTRALEAAWVKVLSFPEDADHLLHTKISVEQKYSLIRVIESIQEGVWGHIEELVRDLDMVEYRIRKVQTELRSLPNDARDHELEDKERECLEHIKSLSEQLGALVVEERRLEHERAIVQRSYEVASRNVKLTIDAGPKVEKARAIRGTVAEFIRRLAAQKAEHLQRYLTRMFTQLARKEDLVREFIVDPNTFRIEVIGADGQRLGLNALSAGEKELFALSFVWALGRVAVQDLPMVIDTPLARLDSIHRAHIAEKFLPNAGRQIIVLSTDKEIDDRLYLLLKPYISVAYRLEYIGKDLGTRVLPGYFFDEAVTGRVS